MRYININNLMNESLSFRAILTKVTFVMVSVASLMIDPTCFALRLPLGTFILAHVLVKCHLEAFVALSRNSEIFC
jgi:DMSO/TMAO reductase YedYZ heme-binding membrane subunit